MKDKKIKFIDINLQVASEYLKKMIYCLKQRKYVTYY